MPSFYQSQLAFVSLTRIDLGEPSFVPQVVAWSSSFDFHILTERLSTFITAPECLVLAENP